MIGSTQQEAPIKAKKLATTPPLANNPGRLTGSASYNPDSVYVAYSNAGYTTVYADVTNVSGFEQNQVFTLTPDGNSFCIGDVA